MLSGREKISVRQAMLLFVTTAFTPSVRFVATFTASKAKQAAWLSPLVSFAFLILLVLILHSFYKTHKNTSFAGVMDSIAGKFAGKILLTLYIIWLIILLALYVRFFAERLNSSIYPEAKMSLFIIVMLALVAFVLRSGIVVIARMNELIIPFVTIVFLLLTVFAMPELEFKKLTPIIYRDVYPVIQGGIGITGLWVYITVIFTFSDKINNRESIKKTGFQSAFFLLFVTTLLVVIAVGTLGYSIIERAPLSYLATVKQISLFDILERVESVLVATWIATDFILISVFAYSILCMIKQLFGLSDEKRFINIFLVFLYFMSLFISNEVFELQSFSNEFIIYVNVVVGFVIPLFLFGIGKIRRKI